MDMEGKETLLSGEKEMRDFAHKIAHRIASKGPASGQATILALSGELGSGKTTFAKGFAKAWGIAEPVVSPTFILSRTYRVPKGMSKGMSFERFVHIDAYRLSGPEELSHLGWNDILSDEKALVLVEWAEKIAGALPEKIHTFTFEHADGRRRKVIFHYAEEKRKQ